MDKAKTKSAIKVWRGVWGDYAIPGSVYSAVSRWTKDGWPHKQDKGRPEFMAWVDQQEEAARAAELVGA